MNTKIDQEITSTDNLSFDQAKGTLNIYFKKLLRVGAIFITWYNHSKRHFVGFK